MQITRNNRSDVLPLSRVMRPRSLLVPVAAVFSVVTMILTGGCALPKPWEINVVYPGAQRVLSEDSVVLVKSWSLHVLRVCSIDGAPVPDVVEYHLRPGRHEIVTGVSRGESEELPLNCELCPGFVYSLSAELWNLSSKLELVLGCQKVEFDWRPRIVELGRYDELTSGRYVHKKVFQHVRPRPISAMLIVHESVAAPFGEVRCAHYEGVGNLASFLLVFPVEMPPEHWGVWPKNWRFARADEMFAEDAPGPR